MIELTYEPVTKSASIEETDNVFEEILKEETQQILDQTTQEIPQEKEQEPHNQTQASLGSPIGSKKRARSYNDTESDEEAAQRL